MRQLITRLTSLVNSQLRRNILVGTGTAVLNAILSLLSYPIYLHYLGFQKYGVWLALSTVLTFAQLGNLGMNPAVSKLVAESNGRRDVPGVQRCLTTAWLAVSFSGFMVVAIVAIAKQHILSLFGLTGANAALMENLLLYVALFSVYIFIVEPLNATIVGLGRADLESYSRTLSQLAALILSVVFLFFRLGVAGLLLANVLAYVLMHIVGFCVVRRITGAKLSTARGVNFRGISRMLRFGGWVFGGGIVNMTLHPVNRILISRYAGVGALPVYEIAFGASMRIRNLLEGGIRAMMPEISRISAPITIGTLKRAKSLKRAGDRVIVTMGIPVYLFLMLSATPLLKIWLRAQYHPGFPSIFRIMLVGSFSSLLCVPGYYILLGIGEAKSCFISAIIQSGATFGCIALLALLGREISVFTVSLSLVAGISLCTVYLLAKMKQLGNNRSMTSVPAPSTPLSSEVV